MHALTNLKVFWTFLYFKLFSKNSKTILRRESEHFSCKPRYKRLNYYNRSNWAYMYNYIRDTFETSGTNLQLSVVQCSTQCNRNNINFLASWKYNEVLKLIESTSTSKNHYVQFLCTKMSRTSLHCVSCNQWQKTKWFELPLFLPFTVFAN